MDVGKSDIYTFLDCPYRNQIKDYDDGGMLSQCNAEKCTVSCEYNLLEKICPLEYVR